MIKQFAASDERILGISLSRNQGHQKALLAGLVNARKNCDIAISIDCDGQDDISASKLMIDEYLNGADVVYGVRSKRESDTLFKRGSAELFYKFMSWLGAEVVFNHADYRLLSSRALDGLMEFKEANLFLRGLIPLVGLKTAVVEYERTERFAGDGHYSLSKMLGLALDGITSLSMKPIRLLMASGIVFFLMGVAVAIWACVTAITGNAVAGWASLACLISVIGSLQLLSLGVIGEYVGKTYLETKNRPRFIVAERTW